MMPHTNGEVKSTVFSCHNDGSDMTVLVVDDDPDILDLTSTFLEREKDGFSVISHSDPTDAIEQIDQVDIDAIVSDYDMPSLNGLELLEAIREDCQSPRGQAPRLVSGLPF